MRESLPTVTRKDVVLPFLVRIVQRAREPLAHFFFLHGAET